MTPKPPITPRSKAKARCEAKSAKEVKVAGTPLLQAPSASPRELSSAPPLASTALPEASRRAALLQRTFGLDALRCPKCAAKMRAPATLIEPGAVKKILSHLGLRTEPLPLACARDPTGQVDFGFDAA